MTDTLPTNRFEAILMCAGAEHANAVSVAALLTERAKALTFHFGGKVWGDDSAESYICRVLFGEHREASRFGVLMSDASVRVMAASLGYPTVEGEYSEPDKIRARLAIILRGTDWAELPPRWAETVQGIQIRVAAGEEVTDSEREFLSAYEVAWAQFSAEMDADPQGTIDKYADRIFDREVAS